MKKYQKYFISLILSYKVSKKTDFSFVPPTKPAQAISSIFTPKTKLRPNWQQSTTEMAVARMRCAADSLELFHIIDSNI